MNDREDDPERCVPFAEDLPGAATGRAEEAPRRATPQAHPSSRAAGLGLSGQAQGRHLRDGIGGACGVGTAGQGLTTPSTEKKMTMAKQA